MNAHDAAEKLRPDFRLAHMPPEDRHHIKFVEDVAVELGVEATPFNLQQVAAALDAADIHGDDLHFPLMLYSRSHHAVDGVAASTYYPRHDMTFVTVENEDQLKALGPGWVENPADLPARGEIPIAAPLVDKPDLPEPDGEEHLFTRSEKGAGADGDGYFDPSNSAHNERSVAEEAKRVEEIRAERAKVDAAEKAAADERARLAVLQTIAKDSRAEIK
jgi:hypothetical protein